MDSEAKPLVDEWAVAKFRELRQRPPSKVPVSRRIAVISTPRCGSTLFCTSMNSTGLFGEAHEWLNTGHISCYAEVANLQNVDIGAYLNHVIERTTSPNGVFSINVHVDQIIDWKRQGLDVMSLKFDRVIYLYRRDKLSQAYSFLKAIETGRWQTTLSGHRELGAAGLPTAKVLRMLKSIVDWDLQFNENFDALIAGRFAYEDFATDSNVYRKALEVCGIDCPPTVSFTTSLGILRTTADEERVAAIRDYLVGPPDEKSVS